MDLANHYFISYSSVDGSEFALRLADALQAGPPHFRAWVYPRDLKPGQDWDTQLVEAIRVCEGMLFVMTLDSVEDQSGCKQEWICALQYKKPVIPLLLHRDAEMPFRLEPRQHIDFTNSFEQGLAHLRQHLSGLATPEGALQGLNDRLSGARRDLRRAPDAKESARIQVEMDLLEKQIVDQQRLIEDPQGAAQRTAESIARGLERERRPERPLGGERDTRFINPPPLLAPVYFQNRYTEERLIASFLKDEASRLMVVVGRAGMGKTALVCRILKSLEGGRLPDDLGPLRVDGIAYLSAVGARLVNLPNLYADLGKLLPGEAAGRLDRLYRDPQVSTQAKVQALLAEFPTGRTIVLLDNFEDLVDPETQDLRDAELDEGLRVLLAAPHHAVQAILTTRIAPRGLALFQPGRQRRLELGKGLESPFAENILREMDADGSLGLKTASDEALGRARKVTLGNPRALEALYAILSADRYTTLEEILAKAEKTLPENVVEALVGEAFSRLDGTAQQVLQALAVYGRPVSPAAVDYLLQAYLPAVNSAPVLNRLVTMHFAGKEGGHYKLHPVDRAYAFGRIMREEEEGRDLTPQPMGQALPLLSGDEVRSGSWSQLTLLHRAADYFRQARRPRQEWKTLDDLAAQLAEFDLRCAAEEWSTAAEVLNEISFHYLLLWGHYRLLAGLHERLQGHLKEPRLKGSNLLGLGNAYSSMGQYQKAISCYEQALAIHREIGDRGGEGAVLGNLAEVYVDNMRFSQAILLAQESVIIGVEISNPTICNWSYGHIALAQLYAGNMQEAQEAIGNALQFDQPDHNHYTLSLSGVISLWQGDYINAQDAFQAAISQAEALLAETPHFYSGFDTKALALCGLALSLAASGLDSPSQIYVGQAIEAYQAARAINRDPGVVDRVWRLFNALAVLDAQGVLAGVREAASGEYRD